MNNINTKEYWERRFSSGDWQEKGGRWQTKWFAEGVVKHLGIPRDYSGTILDYGCAHGDAIPVLHSSFPNAKLYGVDISGSAIEKCIDRYGDLCEFSVSDYENIPEVDVIIASNVLEHLDNDVDIIKSLLGRCKKLFIVVPYREHPVDREHIRTYDEHTYKSVGQYTYKIYPCKGWSQYGFKLWFDIYFKNILRIMLLRKPARRGKQIMFCFTSNGTIQ